MRRVVVIGGGTGLPVLIQSLEPLGVNIDAVVTVADDGGSSGVLRDELDGFPPGDSRNCLVAMAQDSTIGRLFQHRFSRGDGLKTHALGNLIIAALVEIEGDFQKALSAAGRLVGARGRVLPPSLVPLTLVGQVEAWGGEHQGQAGLVRISGQCNIANRLRPLRSIGIEPADAPACPNALSAIDQADTIILGPGSLFTSVLPNLLINELGESVRRAAATKIFICNVAEQPGETDHLTAPGHLEALRSFSGVIPDVVVSSTTRLTTEALAVLEIAKAPPVLIDSPAIKRLGIDSITADLTDEAQPTRHDPVKLGRLWQEVL